MLVTRSDFVHACNVHLHAIVEKDLPLTIFGRVSGQLGFVWAVPDAVHFSICWICDFLQVSGVWWSLVCCLCMISGMNLLSSFCIAVFAMQNLNCGISYKKHG